MKIAMIQPAVTEDTRENLKQVLQSLHEVSEQNADLAVLPELWNVPFINRKIREHSQDGIFLLQALQKAAVRENLWIVGGTFCWPESKKVYNRCFVIDPEGKIAASADKCHLLEVHTSRTTYRESDVFSAGESLCRFDTPWGQAGICICYDLRFPEMARLLSENSIFLFAPAGFNEQVGKKHWKNLICTRAMENEVFVVAVNPQAKDYGSYSSYGHSIVADPDGQIVCEMAPDQPYAIVEIDPGMVEKIRSRSPYWNLRRQDLYRLEELNREPAES